MGLFYDYKKGGSGVKKRKESEGKLSMFFSTYFRNFWKFLSLTFIYLLACIPIVTLGPATAGLTSVLKKFSMQKHPFIWADFWESFKKNFKQSFIIGIIDLITIASIITGLMVYPQLADKSSSAFLIPLVLSFSIGIIVVIMNFYVYLMIVSVDLKLWAIIKNSFILSCVAIKTNLLTFFIIILFAGAIFGLMFINILFVLLYPLLVVTFITYVSVFNSYPIIQKYIVNPYYEANGIPNPEDDDLSLNDDAIFEDALDKEKTKK